MVAGILHAAILIGVIGILIGLLLGFAAIKLAVPVDEKEIEVREFLPGNNCGGCGYAGCDALAKAIAAGEAPVNACPVRRRSSRREDRSGHGRGCRRGSQDGCLCEM